MSFMFRRATRENVWLMVSLAGGTGSGKTFSALELATGIAGDKPFAVIDTEAGRAKHYADRFRFDHGDLKPPFRPSAYLEAIVAAEEAGYPVVVVDSGSHEHAGEGGLLDWHDEELDRIAGNDYGKRQACAMTAWIKPKADHKRFVQRLLQLRCHLILCLRAEEKVEIGKDDKGKTVVRPKSSVVGKDGWMPVCEKNLPYEMTTSFLLLAERPGYGVPIKLQEQHRHLFPSDRPIGRASGEALAAWARGAGATTSKAAPSSGPVVPWGADKGKPIAELEEAALGRYLRAAQKAVEDPKRAASKGADQRWLALLEAESARRLAGSAAPAREG